MAFHLILNSKKLRFAVRNFQRRLSCSLWRFRRTNSKEIQNTSILAIWTADKENHNTWTWLGFWTTSTFSTDLTSGREVSWKGEIPSHFFMTTKIQINRKEPHSKTIRLHWEKMRYQMIRYNYQRSTVLRMQHLPHPCMSASLRS